MKIPRTMSTQHPDNVTLPFFAHQPVLHGDDEIKEAFYAFSHLGAEEIMWDAEGKEADDFVVRKLLTDYPAFFERNRIGRDIFITTRIPNPDYEKAEAKVLLEALESIPRSYDTSRLFYGNGQYPPMFEVIVPMADGPIIRKIFDYYKNIVAGKEQMRFMDRGGETVGGWIGAFRPKSVNVIPLFEDIPSMLSADRVLGAYMKDKNVRSQRVFLARSDPAMNYSSAAVILALHITLDRLHKFARKNDVEVHPILGSGSAPFRGHLTPQTVDYLLDKYPSVATFTVQSAFKYDAPVDEVQRAIAKINQTSVRPPDPMEDEKRALQIIRKVSVAYRRQIQVLAPLINELSRFVPQRRMRKLHTGLFGYSRELKHGVKLPRVISFCAVLYSIGLPPDLLGLQVLTPSDRKFITSVYPRFEENLCDTLRFWNPNVLALLPASVRNEIRSVVARYDVPVFEAYREASQDLIDEVGKKRFGATVTDLITRSGFLRGFLG